MRKITEIIIHCTATPNDWRDGDSTAAKVAEVKRWHTAPKPVGRGWSDIGYHFLIDRDGTVATGRPLERDGAHVMGRNTGTIGISLFGGASSAATDKFEDNFTPAQDAALRRLIANLQGQFGPVPVTGHNQYAAKACPGFHAPTWFRSVPATGPAPAPGSVDTPPTTAEASVLRWRLAEIRDIAIQALG